GVTGFGFDLVRYLFAGVVDGR
uniref:5-methyltetrahydropteroyltriglutamate--homocysteine methyltransferase (Fragments) n=1 Tax=Populus euphratica TaxID=75702 RepID=METE_POPEU|nr:RecName: Full=5-methyltetrahydropteroyltriglutamate--homocysteine methyltransferase; AltName: Full=Cobalamin-independent methionine synthase isozyme; AltName: Full=Vitamin-B12-independent methionine synthase isozyme [Populus euphratica]